MEQRRIVVTMGCSDTSQGVFVPNPRKGEALELAEDLAGALRSCFERPCERLYVSLMAPDPDQLTSLAHFRMMRPSQYIVLVVDESIQEMMENLKIADEYVTIQG